MACSLKTGLCIYGMNEASFRPKSKGVQSSCSSFGSSQPKESLVLCSRFMGKRMCIMDQKCSRDWTLKTRKNFSVQVSKLFFFFFLFIVGLEI